MNFAQMRISTRLYGGFLLTLAFLLVSTVFALNRMVDINQRMVEIIDVNNVEADLLTVMQLSLQDRRIAARNLILLTDVAQMQPEADRILVQEKNTVMPRPS
ncbi:hypothetical protein COAQ111491_14965 [Comamonas aquatilis]|uniref:MCP four helix bundle domain-containing protein n=1 Tax=Comamonas aquatilis TaxID=1778406 RepID=UPI0039EF1572